ncbi:MULTISPECIES: adenosylcobinamide-phosphate synthase CbiB [unclassified Rhizobium]|uniref:adenosylcobinamide-phosphate synthase CbiB n=1 Tax=unclassified Rhizobium TaxID=2613769 RepID=UPI001ADD3B42|nr:MULTISPECIES: adenosylcobinamide-phosphate synthase CbiB [unclassified Rhizobium]MBO9124601.1 cobalamin biosynthesis protein [Rhizobium sp. 16-488-2b]MBO9175185.1 cobalamin biosynthesis protein [Rhizobium sp. 16-488-2a]
MIFELNLLVLVLALMLDRIVGDPDVLWARLPHPIVLFGKAISRMETLFNRTELPGKSRRRNGMLVIAALLLIAVVAGVALHLFFALFGLAGILLEVLCVTVFLAQKSLADHVEAVATGLRQGGLDGGRKAVSMIVGRDPETLDEPAVCRAAIESLAENFSDGVVAPALWYLVFGLPGLLAYKMLNTADSMIGHKSERYVDFGWASARLDDLANWPAARLSIALIAAGAWLRRGGDACREAFTIAMRDGGMHRSPNSGRPEAAMAGALNVQLAGPRVYSGVVVMEPMINGGGRETAVIEDIESAVSVFYASCSVLAFVALVIFLFLL